jgi:hypothetical protein
MVDLAVGNHAVETFLRRRGEEFIGQGDVLFGRETEMIKNLRDLGLRFFDATADFDFLFRCQQRHRAHLLEVHAHRIVQPVGTAAIFGFLRRDQPQQIAVGCVAGGRFGSFIVGWRLKPFFHIVVCGGQWDNGVIAETNGYLLQRQAAVKSQGTHIARTHIKFFQVLRL